MGKDPENVGISTFFPLIACQKVFFCFGKFLASAARLALFSIWFFLSFHGD